MKVLDSELSVTPLQAKTAFSIEVLRRYQKIDLRKRALNLVSLNFEISQILPIEAFGKGPVDTSNGKRCSVIAFDHETQVEFIEISQSCDVF